MILTKGMKLEILFKNKELSRATELMNKLQNISDFVSESLDTDDALQEVYKDVQELISLIGDLPELVKSMNTVTKGSEFLDFKTFLFKLEGVILDLLEGD